MNTEEPIDAGDIPTVASVPTRRAFVIAGGTFVMGAALGGSYGYSLAATREASPMDSDEEPSGDEVLEELRRLAKGPIRELIVRKIDFLYHLGKSYRRDEILWHGFDRLCAAALTDPDFPDRRLTARLLVQMVDYAEPEYKNRFSARAAELGSIH